MFTTVFALAVFGQSVLSAPMVSELSPSTLKRSETSSSPSTFYIVENDSGTLANANPDPSGVYFGSSWNSPTLFTIDSSTSILLTADPGQTAYDSYVETSNFSPVQIGTAASSGFITCSITNNQLSCSSDNGYTQFMLDSSSENSTDYQLYLVQSGTTSTSARSVTLGVQSASPEPAPLPTKFYLSTAMGYAVDFGTSSGIYAGSNFAKEGPGSVYTLNSSTGYLTSANSSGVSTSASCVAYIDSTAANGYSMVQLSPLPLPSDTMVPLDCQAATDGSLNLSCQANDYQQMWLDRVSTTSGDYTLYMAKPDSAGKGTERVNAQVKLSNCTSCS